MAKAVKQSAGKPPDARRERWRAHREARRAEFVEATIRAIQQRGTDIAMEDIAAEAGVSKPVIYRHFTDKADLYLAVSSRAMELLMEQMEPAIDRGGPVQAWIKGIIDAYLRTVEDHPQLYRFVINRTFTDQPVETDPVSTDKTIIATTLARLLGDYLRVFNLDSGGAEPWAFGIVGMVQAAGDWWLDRNTMSRDNLAEYLTTMIWHAIDGFARANDIVLDPAKSIGRNLTAIAEAKTEAATQAGEAGSAELAEHGSLDSVVPLRLVADAATNPDH